MNRIQRTAVLVASMGLALAGVAGVAHASDDEDGHGGFNFFGQSHGSQGSYHRKEAGNEVRHDSGYSYDSDDDYDDSDSCGSAIQDPDCGLGEQQPRYRRTPKDNP